MALTAQALYAANARVHVSVSLGKSAAGLDVEAF